MQYKPILAHSFYWLSVFSEAKDAQVIAIDSCGQFL